MLRLDVLIMFVAVFQKALDLTEQEKYARQFREFLISEDQHTWSIGLVVFLAILELL